jgi:hypothetical protein
MGETKGALDEIIKISETKPNLLDAKGILIATFSSIAEPSELTEWFIENNRSFLIFDLSKKSSGFNRWFLGRLNSIFMKLYILENCIFDIL